MLALHFGSGRSCISMSLLFVVCILSTSVGFVSKLKLGCPLSPTA